MIDPVETTNVQLGGNLSSDVAVGGLIGARVAVLRGHDWIRRVVTAVIVQRETGGNLAEVLQTAADTMLQRNRLRREMKALTAEGRVSAIVLGSLPFFLFAFLFLTRRDYLQPMLDSTTGLVALGVAFLGLLLGIFWLSRIVKVDV